MRVLCNVKDITGSVQSTGGYGYSAQLETKVTTPMLAVTQGEQPNASFARFGAAPSPPCAGDPLWASQQMSFLLSERQYASKIRPRFHPIDFLEFGDVLAQWVSTLQSTAVRDPNYVLTSLSEANSALTYQCPITLQEMLLILRNEMMWAYKSTQPGVQGLLPIVPSSSSDNQLTPLLCGTNACANTVAGMKLPLPFVENIKALVYRQIEMAGGGDVMQWVPVLSKYFLDNLNTTDYLYTFPEGQGIDPQNSFVMVPPTQKLSKDPKTGKEMWVTDTLETAIDLVDGSAAGGALVFINDPGRLNQLVTLWNNWLSNQLSTYSDPLTTVATDTGTAITCSVAMTRYWIGPPTLSKKHDAIRRDQRISSVPRFVATPYAQRNAIAISSHGTFLSGPYEEVLSQWILPSVQITAQSSSIKWQAMMGENNQATSSSGVEGQSYALLHAAYATKMVHGPNAPNSNWAQFFQDATRKGNGGILSGLLASVAGSLLGKQAGDFADSIAEALPI